HAPGPFDPKSTYDSCVLSDLPLETVTNYQWSGPGIAPTRIPPYGRPLRAIQINLRVLEEKTGIIREQVIVHRFPQVP
ncbi:MAG: hypothetical protein ACRDD1_19735, partial [Planctomycetia bacterium]